MRSYTGGELPRGRFVLRSVAMAMSRHVFGSEQLVSRQVGLALEIGDGEYTSAAVTSTGEIERQKGTFTATDTQISFEPSCGPESPARGTAVRLGPQTDYDVESDTIGMRANVRDTADGSDGATFIPVNIVLERE